MTYPIGALLDDPPRFVTFDDFARGEARRLARYDWLLGELVNGQISRDAFRQTVRRWAPFRGKRFLADAETALTIIYDRRQADTGSHWETFGRSRCGTGSDHYDPIYDECSDNSD